MLLYFFFFFRITKWLLVVDLDPCKCAIRYLPRFFFFPLLCLFVFFLHNWDTGLREGAESHTRTVQVGTIWSMVKTIGLLPHSL